MKFRAELITKNKLTETIIFEVNNNTGKVTYKYKNYSSENLLKIMKKKNKEFDIEKDSSITLLAYLLSQNNQIIKLAKLNKGQQKGYMDDDNNDKKIIITKLNDEKLDILSLDHSQFKFIEKVEFVDENTGNREEIYRTPNSNNIEKDNDHHMIFKAKLLNKKRRIKEKINFYIDIKKNKIIYGTDPNISENLKEVIEKQKKEFTEDTECFIEHLPNLLNQKSLISKLGHLSKKKSIDCIIENDVGERIIIIKENNVIVKKSSNDMQKNRNTKKLYYIDESSEFWKKLKESEKSNDENKTNFPIEKIMYLVDNKEDKIYYSLMSSIEGFSVIPRKLIYLEYRKYIKDNFFKTKSPKFFIENKFKSHVEFQIFLIKDFRHQLYENEKNNSIVDNFATTKNYTPEEINAIKSSIKKISTMS
ncbi:hypothetical protein [Methanobrevibacter sp. DSM 116169]|uniref:hypothetical protein n=1 Tax=Methanobrevibacter sp. DSM 116169 TaxID=3242727 RepID=UPI0038FC4C71